MNCCNHPDRERVAFCQNCGKPLCSECMRTIGSAVFCEPCLAARLAAADAATSQAASTGGTPYGYVNVPAYAPAASLAPMVPGGPNPILAGALGFIPGVGAMYNGQYAKGVVHLAVFAVLVSLTSDVNGVFGLFVAGWEFYQAFEAYHTARARRDGAPLPNPFGLNDIGEKLGFGKGWTTAATSSAAPSSFGTSTDGPVTRPVGDTSSYAAAGSVPTYATAVPSFSQPPFKQTGGAWAASATNYSYAAPIGAPPVYAVPPYPYQSPMQPVAQSSFPIGAVLLIILGLLFFFGSTGILREFYFHRVVPFILCATGEWIFFKPMTRSGQSIGNDGTPLYQLRLFRAARGAVWVVLVGVLFLLDSFNILTWGHSWPLFIVLGGLMTFFERAAMNNAALPATYPDPLQASGGTTTGPLAGAPNVPTSSSEEGR